MTKNQENKLSMYLTVQKVTNFHSNAWQDLQAFKSRFAEFESLIEMIRETRTVQEGMITGVAKNKARVQDKAIEKGVEIAMASFAYASVTGNDKLKDRVSYSPSKLKLSRDTMIIDSLNVILKESQKLIPQLADYGISQEDITAFAKLKDDYAAVVENPRQALTNRSRSTKELSEYIAQADTVLKEQLDKLIFQFRTASPVFFKQYKSARLIIGLGHRKRVKKEESQDVA